ncbi:MAG: histidine phosphatase family protein, partial [Gammaproteobacteria bacterium]|nr:histidine phosphatase family protein [Gammaproteobacteria bacterium]
MKSKVVYVLRHGQTEWNLAGRMQGRMDSPLTALGEAQADAHGALLKSLGGVDE